MSFSGVIVPLITPLNEDERVDTVCLREYVHWLLQSGVHGVLAGGSMGEYPNLEEREKEKVFKTVSEFAADKVVVMVNISDTAEKRVLRNIERVRNFPVHAYVLTPPYYFLHKPSELEAFFFRIADAAEKPLLAYNIPEFVGNKLSVDTILALSRHPMITGLKDSSGDFGQFVSLLLEKPDTFRVFQGYTEMSLPSLLLGCDGLISGLSNVIPGWFVRLFTLAKEGKIAEARVCQRDINRISQVFVKYGFLVSVKYALSVLQLCSPRATRPFSEVSPEGQREIETILKEYAIL